MLKNLFKAAKKALKNPLVQLGIGAFLPSAGFMSKLPAIFSNPAVIQGGIGLLAGDKPENVARNIGIQALLGGVTAGPDKTFSEGVMDTFRTPTRGEIDTLRDKSIAARGTSAAEEAAKGAPENFLKRLADDVTPQNVIDAATLAVPFIAGALEDANQQQLDPNAISGLDFQNYLDAQKESQYQATGGITGFARGGADPTNGMNRVSYGSTMGEPNGLFTGPGGPKEDKIDVMLSPGEFVMTAEATKKIGVDNLYDMMNNVDPDSERPEEYRERVGMA